MKRRFRVVGTFDKAGGLQRATVEIDTLAMTIAVRPYRRRRWYGPMPLASAASWVCRVVIQAEVRERREAKKARRKRR